MEGDEKTCIKHYVKSNVRSEEYCFLNVLLNLQGTLAWGYSDGSYRYQDLSGSTYYEDGEGQAIYDRYGFHDPLCTYVHMWKCRSRILTNILAAQTDQVPTRPTTTRIRKQKKRCKTPENKANACNHL